MNTLNRIRILILFVLIWSLTSCGRIDKPSEATSQVPANERILVYKGLPHPFFDKAAFEEESKAKSTRDLNGYQFYLEPLTIREADAKSLLDILKDPATYQPFSGEKKCGGFHPDYAIEWSVDGGKHSALICFGCGEIKRFRPSGDSRYDIGSQDLSGILKAYQQNRLAKVRPE